MQALEPVEGPERSWAWFAEGPDEGGVVLGTSQKRVKCQMSDSRTVQEALAELKGISLAVYRQEAAQKEKIRKRGEGYRRQPPTQWPQLKFNWDLSQASQRYVYDSVQPEQFTQWHPEGLQLGYVDLKEFDKHLCHLNRRNDLDELWKYGNASKLSDVLSYLQEGLPMTPPLVSVANGELCFAGGNHRYTAAKFSGEKRVPIYVERASVSVVDSLLQVDWVGI